MEVERWKRKKVRLEEEGCKEEKEARKEEEKMKISEEMGNNGEKESMEINER